MLHRIRTYTADSHPKGTKPRQRNNLNVNCYNNTEDSQKKQTVIKGNVDVPPWNGPRQIS